MPQPRSRISVTEKGTRGNQLLYVYLAMTGGVVVFPQGDAVIDEEGKSDIHIVDKEGRVLAVFQRPDVSIYSHELIRPEDTVV
jgi:hypothetical protein